MTVAPLDTDKLLYDYIRFVRVELDLLSIIHERAVFMSMPSSYQPRHPPPDLPGWCDGGNCRLDRDHLAIVEQSIEDRGCHHVVAEHVKPIRKALIRREQDAAGAVSCRH